MAFRKKVEPILQYRPDILVVPECEPLEKLKMDEWSVTPTSAQYLPVQKNIAGVTAAGKKGLAVFSFGQYHLQILRSYSDAFEIIMPLRVTGVTESLNLFAVWTLDTLQGHYVEHAWKAVEHYKRSILRERTILIGDFNSNIIFDRKGRESSHGNMVARLARKGIASVYHHHFGQRQGLEADPTFYLYRHEDKPYHLDHCFVSADLLQKLISVEVGKFADWREYSDHVPMMVTLA